MSIQNPGDAWFWHPGHTFDSPAELFRLYVGAPRWPFHAVRSTLDAPRRLLHAGRSTLAAPCRPLHAGIAVLLLNADVRSILMGWGFFSLFSSGWPHSKGTLRPLGGACTGSSTCHQTPPASSQRSTCVLSRGPVKTLMTHPLRFWLTRGH